MRPGGLPTTHGRKSHPPPLLRGTLGKGDMSEPFRAFPDGFTHSAVLSGP